MGKGWVVVADLVRADAVLLLRAEVGDGYVVKVGDGSLRLTLTVLSGLEGYKKRCI